MSSFVSKVHGMWPGLWVLAAAALCLPAHAQHSGEAVQVRLRWRPGHTYTQETTTETQTNLKALGQDQEQKLKVVQTTKVQVTTPNDQEKEARVTFASATGEVQAQGKTHLFNSDNLEAAPPAIRASLGQSVGTSFVLVYGRDDTFLRVRDASDMVAPKDGVPSLGKIAEANEVADLFRRSLEMGLPKTQVKPGDGWSYQEMVRFPSAGLVKSDLRGRFESVVEYAGKPHAKITFEGDLKNAGSGLVSPGSVGLGEGSKTEGQILFDLDGGIISFATFQADVFLILQGKPVPVRQQVTTRLVGVDPPL
jgi:hypothetical protein